MKKRALAFLCWVLLLLSLFACSTGTPAGDSSSQANSNQSDEPKSDVLALLEAAGEKLRNAESFEMKMIETGYSKEYVLLQMQYVADKDGAPASFLKANTKPYATGSSYSMFRYLSGNSGFEGTLKEGKDFVYNKKHIRDEKFNDSQHFWFIQDAFDIQNSNMFEKFCQLEHSVTTAEDGTVTILFEDLTGVQIDYFMNVDNPMNLGTRSVILDHFYATTSRFGDQVKLSVEFSVDPQGYLSKIQINRWQFVPAQLEYTLTQARSLAFSCYNEEMELQEPGFEAKFKRDPDSYPEVYHHFGEHHSAWYSYDAENSTYYLRGPNYMYDENGAGGYIDTYYKVPSDIDGIPISKIAFDNYCADIKGLIIPKTAAISGSGHGYGTLFFEDSREDRRETIKGDFDVPCYFAGEWKYVDGVPTPIQ